MTLKFQINSIKNLSKLDSDCLIIFISDVNNLSLPKNTITYIKQIIKQENFNSKINLHKLIMLFQVPDLKTHRLLLINNINNNQEEKFTELQFLELIKNICSNLNKYNIYNTTICMPDCKITNHDLTWQVYQTITNSQNNLYTFNQFKSSKNINSKPINSRSNKNMNYLINSLPYKDVNDHNNTYENKLISINILVPHKLLPTTNLILKQSIAVNNACKLVKDLANTPPNICNTIYLEETATKLKNKFSKLKLTVLEKKDLITLNMGAFLAVAQGSLQPPKLICLEYHGQPLKNNKKYKNIKEKLRPIVLIGKGITFDTGGNSLKPANSMIGMKFDMCGAATVLGVMHFVAEMQLPLNIIGIAVTAENMPGRHASRPDDVVTTMSGLTVEILNTDAEGRLLLCEALTYCKKFNPKAVIDVATLTGSCAATFGHHYSGLFSNNQELTNKLLAAANKTYDKAWQLPISSEYHKMLDSDIADLANIGGNHAGSITAACFLAKFATDYPWAHLDIAGTAYFQEGKITRNPSGRPIPMLTQYLMDELT